MTNEIHDTRSYHERLTDYTDSKLIDFMQDEGLLVADEEAIYKRADVLRMVRRAYWRGVGDLASDKDGDMARAATDYALKPADEPSPADAA